MKLHKGVIFVLTAALVIGAGMILSGCSTCCGEEAPAKAPATGMLRGTMGCDDCAESSSPILIEKEMPRQVVVGKPFTYTIRVTNRAECVIEDVSVTEKFAEIFDLESANPQASKVEGRVAQWDLGVFNPKETKVITVTGVAKAGGSVVSCTKADYDPVLCMGPGFGLPAILLEVVDTEDPVQVGGAEKFYVTVTNQGTADDTNIVIRMAFEENFDYVSSAGPTQGAAEGTKAVTFAALSSLAPGQKATWEVTAKAASEGDHRTSVKLTSDAIQRSVDETESTHIY